MALVIKQGVLTLLFGFWTVLSDSTVLAQWTQIDPPPDTKVDWVYGLPSNRIFFGAHSVATGKLATYRLEAGTSSRTPVLDQVEINVGWIHAGTDGRLFVILGDSVITSQDEGDSWSFFASFPSDVTAFTPGDDGRHYVITGKWGEAAVLHVSEDNGASWHTKSIFDSPDYHDFPLAAAADGTLYLGYSYRLADTSLLISRDGGESWTGTDIGDGGSHMRPIYAIRVVNDSSVFVWGGGSGWRSTDAGQTWTEWESYGQPMWGVAGDLFAIGNSTPPFLSRLGDDGTWTRILDLPYTARYGAFDREGAFFVTTDLGTLHRYEGLATAFEPESPTSSELSIGQSYPNPFSHSITVLYSLPSTTNVRITVFDVLGRLVTTLTDGRQSTGRHSASWQPHDVPVGTYFVRLETGSATRTRSVQLVK